MIFLAALIATVYCSYTDIFYRRVPNLVVGVLLLLSCVEVLLYPARFSDIGYGLVFGLLIGFAFYVLKVWGAGDAKLFIAVSAIVGIFSFFKFFYFTLLAGGLLALGYILAHASQRRKGHASILSHWLGAVKRDIPYGVAISAGMVALKIFS
ncbi:MAG TPA: prepilin peptidase [Patescibacteria group bacterium]|nr:prepilin peptidase [Patescibacteria group bacterium]